MEPRRRRFVGVDPAKRSMEVCFLSEGGAVERRSYRTDNEGRGRLGAALRKNDCVAVEACSLAFVLSRQLEREVGCRVFILNPGKLAVIRQSTRKTDKEDSYKLASLIQRFREDELRGLVSMKHYLVKLRTSLLNRLHATYVQAGPTFVKKRDPAPARRRAGA